MIKSFKAEAKQVNFKGADEDARRTINEFVAEKTHNMIPEVIGAGQLDSFTRLFLINAVYFNGILCPLLCVLTLEN